MPIKKAAKKALRQTKKRTLRNLKVKKNIEYLLRKAKKQIAAKKKEEAEKIIRQVYKAIDKARQKGILKKNTAARKKARLMKKLNKLQ